MKMEEFKRKKYYDLLLRLEGHVVKGNGDYKRMMKVAKIKDLNSVQLSKDNFDDICECFDSKGLLGPEKLGILKEIFPELENEEAYKDIEQTEKEIKEQKKYLSKATQTVDNEVSDDDWYIVDCVRLKCNCTKEIKPQQTDLIQIKTIYNDQKALTRGKVHNFEQVLKSAIQKRNLMKSQDFSINIVKQKCGNICAFLQIFKVMDKRVMVDRMRKELIPQSSFIYDYDIQIALQSGKFTLKIKTKFRYEKSTCNTTKQRHKLYQAEMTKLLQLTGKKVAVSPIDVKKITEKSEKEFVEFTFVSSDFTTTELKHYLENNCGDPIFKDISIQKYQQEHIHATWLHMNNTCDMKGILEDQLRKSKDESEILDFSICCPDR